MSDVHEKLERYQAAARRAADFTLSFQQPDGGYIWEGFVKDAYHKQTYSWLMAGEYAAANRLLNWIEAHTLQPDGQLKDYGQDIYKHAWLCHGAHRLGRVDMSYPVMRFLASRQTDLGGWRLLETDPYCRVLPTAWAGAAALAMGRLDVATRAAEWCMRLLDQQSDDSRYYYQMDDAGELAACEHDPAGAFIAAAEPQQPYWEVGLPQLLMCRLFMATGEMRYLAYAGRFFDKHFELHEDRFTHTGSGKTSLANATYYLITGDERARDAVLAFGDTLVETQTEEGSWLVGGRTELLYRVDVAAEFTVWLDEIVSILGGMV